MELLSHIVTTFWGPAILFFTVAAPTYTPTASGGGPLSPTPSPASVICVLFDAGRLTGVGSHLPEVWVFLLPSRL